MKKFILLITIFTITLFTNITGVRAATEFNDFNFIFYQNQKYDLVTGVLDPFPDPSYSITNRVLIPNTAIDNKLYFGDTDFHHILFFNANNGYVGYANGANTDLELDSYIGYDVSNDEIIAPANANKFVLMIYNFNNDPAFDTTTHDLVSQVGSIDDLLVGGLTEKPDKNLFNLNDLTADYSVLETTGAVIVDVLYSVSDFISIEPVTDYTISVVNDGYTRYALYDNNYDYISGVLASSPLDITFSSLGASYIKISDLTANVGGIQLEVGGASTTYEPFVSDDDWTAYNSLSYADVFEGTNIIGDYDLLITDIPNYITSFSNVDLISISSLPNSILSGNGSTVYDNAKISGYTETSRDNRNDIGNDLMFYSYLTSIVTLVVAKDTYIDVTDAQTALEGLNVIYRFSIDIGHIDYFDLFASIQYDLTDLFIAGLEPDITTFETWKADYDLYKANEIAIDIVDIGSEDFITNGGFTDFTGWEDYRYDFNTFDFTGSFLTATKDVGVTGAAYIRQNRVSEITNDNSYYWSLDFDSPQYTDVRAIRVYLDTLGAFMQDEIVVTEDGIISEIFTADTNDTYYYFGVYDSNDNDTIKFGNVRGFDLTAIFEPINGAGSEPDLATFEIYLDYYNTNLIDPLADSYSEYFNYVDLLFMTGQYLSIITDPLVTDPLDARTGIDNTLDKLNVNNDTTKVFIALIVMVAAAILVGLKTHNTMFIMLTEVVLIVIFSLLGWFSFWILLLMALVFVLLILKNTLKKE